MDTMASLPLWGGFAAFILLATLIDLGGSRKEQAMTTSQAWRWSLVWLGLAVAFGSLLGLYTWSTQGSALAVQATSQFFTGYLLEKSLAVDNLFVFLLLFRHFQVPDTLQPRALVMGIWVALVLRAGMILAGAGLIQHFHAILYLFGAFLLWSGVKMWKTEPQAEFGENPLSQWMVRRFHVTQGYRGSALWVWEKGRLFLTPLALVFLSIAVTDLVFAVDSIPAIFAVTSDPFLVLTSNLFAVLGLRALYFLLASWVDKFRYLNKGLSLVLTFIGAKMLLAGWVKIHPLLSLAVVVLLLVGSVLLSLHPDQRVGKG